MTESHPLVGRGMTAGASMFRDWFESLSAAGARGEPVAYVFVMGSLCELLKSFDLPTSFPEINSLQTAVRRVAHDYLNEAEDYGFSPDVCGYVKADVGLQIRKGAHPMGHVPPPSLAVLTNACNTYLKWAEIWERMYGIPVFTLDVPGSRMAGGRARRGDPHFDGDCAYVTGQLRELITLCERVSGRKFDIDRLREILDHANAMARAWKRILELNMTTPSVFGALAEGTVYLGVHNAFRGTAEGRRFFDELVEELEFKVANGIGTIERERYRLLFVGVPCYPIFRRFTEMFSEWGGAFVNSTYLWFASGGADLGFQYDLEHPVESLAEGVLASVSHAMDSMFFQDRALMQMLGPYKVDGIAFHGIKSCRTVSTGLADARRSIMEKTGTPSLFIESDMMDKRVVSEAQMKNRIDAFFEGLATHKPAQIVS